MAVFLDTHLAILTLYLRLTGSISSPEKSGPKSYLTHKFGNGDEISFVFDVDKKTIEWSKNGQPMAQEFSIESDYWPLYPTVSLYCASASIVDTSSSLNCSKKRKH